MRSSTEFGTVRLVVLAVTFMLALVTSATAQVKEKKDESTSPAPVVAQVEPQPGPAGEEWWRAGFEPFAGVLQLPPGFETAPPAPEGRATNCCPLGGWVQSLGFNPVWAGNVISISQPLVLKEIQLEANFNGPLQITFGIYREKPNAPVGDYSALCIRRVTLTGNGRGFYSSGPLNGNEGVLLLPKEDNGNPLSTFFAVGVGWGPASIDFRIDNVDYSGGPAFCGGRVRGSWGLLQTNPPAPACPSSHELLGLQFFPTGAISMKMCFEVPGGACCLGDRSCMDDVTQNACVNDLGGEFLGLYSICALDDDGCTGFGACCPDGGPSICAIKTEAECADDIYKGDGTSCDPVVDPCDNDTGACCTYDGACSVMNEYDCEIDPRRDSPGVYQGDTAECFLQPGNIPRCKPLGACCSTTNPNICSDVPEDECVLYDCVNATGPDLCPLGYAIDVNGVCPPPVPPVTQRCFRQIRSFSEGQPCSHGACFGPVGACCLLGECSVTNRLACENAGGVFTDMGADGWQACEILPDNFCETDSNGFNKGACCLPNGNCKLVTAPECVSSNGAFQGTGVACSQFICAQGACCHLESGVPSCTDDLRPFDCADPINGLGGEYQGTGTSCPSNCFITGACCYPDGSCQSVSDQECALGGGTYKGDNTLCEDANCPIPGACCVNFGIFLCFEETDQACAARPQQNKFFTPFGSCANGCGNGACCELDGSCSVVSGPACSAIDDALFEPGGNCAPNNCEVRGACCTASGCELATEEVCSNSLAGVYRGDGVSCSVDQICDIAACCTGSTCEDKFILDCTGLAGEPGELCQAGTCTPGACCIDFDGSGSLFCQAGLRLFECRNLTVAYSQFVGPGTNCTGNPCAGLTSACCKVDGSCEELTAAACNAISGATFQLGETCQSATCVDQTKACCKPDDSCEDLTQAQCAAISGAVYLSGAECATAACPDFPHACCQPNGSCNNLTATQCGAISGAVFISTETCATATCPDFPGACCQPGDVCDDVTAGECSALSGVFLAGQNCSTATCPSFEGACCKPNDTCEDLSSNACAAITNAVFFDGESCATATCPEPTGACCEFDGTCTDSVLESACDALPGATFTPGQTCAVVGCTAGCGARINGDYDQDQDVDLADYAWFQRCFGSGSPECVCAFDADSNGTIDFGDVLVFVVRLNGPNNLDCFPFVSRVPGDYHADGNIDLRDYAGFQLCFESVGSAECVCIFDVDKNGEVNLLDLEGFNQILKGPQ